MKYDSVYNQKNKENQETTNDKLWLFSSNEVADMIADSNYYHPLEGAVYEKFKDTNEGRNNARIPYIVDPRDVNKIGSSKWVWLRSSAENLDNVALLVNSAGFVGGNHAYNYYGVSVGFTLKR